MFQILVFLSTRISGLGHSISRLSHGLCALILSTTSRHLKLALPPLASPSLLLGASAASPGPSLFTIHLSVIHEWSRAFLAEGSGSHHNMFILMGGNAARIIGSLIVLALLTLLYPPSSSDLGNLFSVFFSWAPSATATLSSFIHAACCPKVRSVS
jgi:hypothetical protein